MTIKVQKSSAKYGLVVILIISLFIAGIFYYMRDSRITFLTANISQLSKIEGDFSQIDSCVLFMYKADNNSRLFEVTGDKKYVRQYAHEINKVASLINRLAVNEKANPLSHNIKGLVELKRNKIEAYFKLKHLTDSLVSLNSSIDTLKERSVSVSVETTKGNFKTMVVIDTIRPSGEKAKNLFGRLAGAFSKKKTDTAVTLVKKEITLDTSLSSKKYNMMQIRNINDYFRKKYATHRALKDYELEILNINTKIISQVVHLLQELKNDEISFIKNHKKNIQYEVDNSFKSLSNIYFAIFGLLLFLVFTIFYNLWKIYKNEVKLIDYSIRTATYAQAKGRFLANMSHEIRTPLNSVIGFSAQLSQENLSVEQKEQVDAIKTSSRFLLDLVNDILDFSKYEAGKVNFDKVSFRPTDAITEVLNTIAVQALQKNIKLEKQILLSDQVCLEGDSLRLKQLLMNLLSNAIKFTHEGSVVLSAELVPVARTKTILKIRVVDTGIGIESNDASLIFDEFSQVSLSSTKNQQKGTGLGLAICKKIVELQNGKISVTSIIGKGSTFTFEIPYDLCDETVSKKNTLAISNVEHLDGKKVLVVDDNKMNVLLAQTVLRKYKIITESAGDGFEAYRLFENNKYDLVLTDIQMPIMGGVELTRMIRTRKENGNSDVPILGVTANVLEEDSAAYLAAGMNDLVLKPYSEKDLVDKIAAQIISG